MTKIIIAYLLIAERKINEFMSHADLRTDSKWYVSAQEVSFNIESEVNESYFSGLIGKSYCNFMRPDNLVNYIEPQQDFWIPAIQYNNKMLIHDSVQEISFGCQSFINENYIKKQDI